jgi:hypothetical protein
VHGVNGGKAGSAPHRPGGSKNTVEGRHAGTTCGRGKSAPPSLLPKCVPLVRIDLLGRTGPPRLHLRVRFGVTDEMPTLGVSLDLWTGGNA